MLSQKLFILQFIERTAMKTVLKASNPGIKNHDQSRRQAIVESNLVTELG